MKCIRLQGKEIQKNLRKLKESNVIATEYRPLKEKDILYVPILEEIEGYDLFDKEFEKKKVKKDFKEEAEKLLDENEKVHLKTAYDIIGSIAILEIDDVLDAKAKAIAETLLECNPNISTVVRKAGAHEGELRIQKYEILAGEKTLTTLHKENNCNLFVTLDEVYYSPRSSTERKRVAENVKKGEKVLVMFSGAGPFVCVIAKNTSASNVVGIELNEKGHELAVKNVMKNKLKNVDLIQGDVRDICPMLKEKDIIFDRIVMPLPKTADEFLPEALMVAKEGTVIHLYDFVDERTFPDETISKISKYCDDFDVLESVKCGQFSPYVFRVCVDFRINARKK